MPSLAEVARAIYGAWRLMLFDADGMTFFDLSTGGFWRSFFAAVVVAPLYAVLVVIDLGAREEVFDAGWAFLATTGTYCLLWASFPVVAVFLTRWLSLTGRYIPLIVAYNWISVPQMVIIATAVLIGTGGGTLGTIGLTLTFAASIFVLVYQWFVTVTALGRSSLTAVGIVLLQVVINELIQIGGYNLI